MAAYAAVDSLLENLKQLLLYRPDLIRNAMDLVKELEEDLQLIKAFLKDSARMWNKEEFFKELARQITSVVYKIEDVIEIAITLAHDKGSRKYFNRLFADSATYNSWAEHFRESRKDIKSILDKIYIARERISTYETEIPKGIQEVPNMENLVGLTYYKLPFYLRPCFLYLGMFPEDFEIPVWRLIRLWIAEGFIEQKRGRTLEETAQGYLEELINRNLVMIEKVNTDGTIKTCRVHDILLEFCKNESATGRENVLQEIKKSAEGGFEPSITNLVGCHRLCIHSSIVEFILSSQLFGPRVRSFLCSAKEESLLPPENASSIPAAFKLLRVLDAEAILFTEFPEELSRLVHLKYLVLSSNFKIIPEAIDELWNLQTLVVYTTARVLEIKANVWNMLQLRHVKTNASAILPKRGHSKKILGEKLQTLGTISPQNCTEDVFEGLRSVRELGIRGLLVSLLDTEGLDKLYNLDKLKLVNDLYSSQSTGSNLPRLPDPKKFPPRLRSLTLCSTYLDWGHMSALGVLDTLQVLKLKEKAFMGKCWDVSSGHFRHLEVLHIERTDLSVWIVADADHFPTLRCLVLRNCEALKVIPSKLGEVPSFQRLDMKRVTKSAVESARKIKAAKERWLKQVQDSPEITELKLYISPVDK